MRQLEWQLPLPHHSLQFTESEEFKALPPQTQGRYLMLERSVRKLQCRGRVEGARGWDDQKCIRLLGTSRRVLPWLEKRGLVRWDVDALVLVHYDVEDEVKRSAFLERQHRLACAGAAARWGLGEPGQIPGGISRGSLDLNPRDNSFDAMPSGIAVRQCPVEQISSWNADPLEIDSDPPEPAHFEEPAPSAAPSGLKRVAAASRPLVANLVLRRRKVGPAPAAPPARLAARAGRSRRELRPPAPGPEAAKRGGAAGPDFKQWYDRYRRLTGVFYLRQDALHEWEHLAMDASERRALWVFTDEKARTYSPEFKAPNPAEFLRVVWQLELRARRAQVRSGQPVEAGDVLAAVLKNLKGRRS